MYSGLTGAAGASSPAGCTAQVVGLAQVARPLIFAASSRISILAPSTHYHLGRTGGTCPFQPCLPASQPQSDNVRSATFEG